MDRLRTDYWWTVDDRIEVFSSVNKLLVDSRQTEAVTTSENKLLVDSTSGQWTTELRLLRRRRSEVVMSGNKLLGWTADKLRLSLHQETSY